MDELLAMDTDFVSINPLMRNIANHIAGPRCAAVHTRAIFQKRL